MRRMLSHENLMNAFILSLQPTFVLPFPFSLSQTVNGFKNTFDTLAILPSDSSVTVSDEHWLSASASGAFQRTSTPLLKGPVELIEKGRDGVRTEGVRIAGPKSTLLNLGSIPPWIVMCRVLIASLLQMLWPESSTL